MLEPELAEKVGVAGRGGAELQAVALEEVDEARVAVGRVGRDVDDPPSTRSRSSDDETVLMTA